MTDQELRFGVDIDASTKKLVLTDTTTYGASELGNSGMIKITDAMGNSVYENPGYATDDFSLSDICHPVGVVAEGRQLTLDADGLIVNQDYNIFYKVGIFTETTLTMANTATEDLGDDTSKITFTAPSTADIATIKEKGYISFTSPAGVVGSYKVVSYEMDGVDLIVIVVGTLDTTSGSADLTVPSSTALYSTTKVATYCYETVIPSIEYIVNCRTSEITSIDATDYMATINGVSTTADTLTRRHTVIPPAGSGYPTIADDSSASRAFYPLWTKVWQTAISTALVFNVEMWDTEYWLTYSDTIVGSDSATVSCSSCSCQLQECIGSLYTQWMEAVGTNMVLAKRLGRDVMAVNAQYTLFQQAERCGKDTSIYCENMSTILKRNNCNCDESSDSGSEEVEPTDESHIVGGGGVEIFIRSYAPNGSLGSNGDMWINPITNYYYLKEVGVWEHKGEFGDNSYDGERVIKSVPVVGEIVGGETYEEFLDNAFFRFIEAYISLNLSVLFYEIGSTPTITISGTLTKEDETSFTDSKVVGGVSDILFTDGATAYSVTDTPIIDTTYKAQVSVGGNGTPTTIESPEKTVGFVYPCYATTSVISTISKQALITSSSDLIVHVVAEGGTDKQIIDIPVSWDAITVIKQLNTLSGEYDTISMSEFTQSNVTHVIQTNTINYIRFTNNTTTTGLRSLKFIS